MSVIKNNHLPGKYLFPGKNCFLKNFLLFPAAFPDQRLKQFGFIRRDVIDAQIEEILHLFPCVHRPDIYFQPEGVCFGDPVFVGF